MINPYRFVRARVTHPHHLHLLRSRHEQGEHVVNVNQVHDEFKVQLGVNGKVATVLTAVYGSMYFVYFLAFGAASWMAWQSILDKHPFDPYPFLLLLFLGNLIQLIGGPVIQVGQNLSSAHSELRAESDYHVNQESFERIEQIMEHLNKQDELILRIVENLEARTQPTQKIKAVKRQEISE